MANVVLHLGMPDKLLNEVVFPGFVKDSLKIKAKCTELFTVLLENVKSALKMMNKQQSELVLSKLKERMPKTETLHTLFMSNIKTVQEKEESSEGN